MRVHTLLALVALFSADSSIAQITDAQKDSIYISEIEEAARLGKVLHAEPLYIDLIRDLGARKGEREWNLGLGLTDQLRFDSYEALIEYEWAPINRLGLEVELPFTLYSSLNGTERDSVPSDRLNSLKVAAQWSFLVDVDRSLSMALGYIHELEVTEFDRFGKPLFEGNVFNPFLVVAKRWGDNFHTLIYTGPKIGKAFGQGIQTSFEINTSIHYMIPGTRNFIGLETNKSADQDSFNAVVRPQMRVGVTDNLLIGIIAGVPVNRSQERFSSFVRLIWEPPHMSKHH